MLKSINKSNFKKYGTLFLLGGLASLAFAPTYLFPLLFISFSGFLLYINQSTNKKEAFWTGWWFGFGHFVVGIYWICISLLVDPSKFAWLIPFTISSIPAALAVFIGFVSLFTFLISKKYGIGVGGKKIILFCLLWGLSETLRSYMFSGFPWNLIGYVWSFSDYMIQITSVIGTYGLGLITIIIVTLPVLILEQYKYSKPNNKNILINLFEDIKKLKPRKKPLILSTKPLFYSIILMLLIWSFGFVRLQDAKTSDIKDVKIRIVQPNISQHQKWDGNLQYKALIKNINISKSPGFKNITHLIWPETAIPYIVNNNEKLLEIISEAIPNNGILISGGLRGTLTNEKKIKNLWNSIFAFDKQNGIIAVYDKSHLVPFGEYVPLSKFLPFIDKITHGSIDFNRGEGVKTIYITSDNFLTISFSPLVCYEAIFPHNVIDIYNRPDFLLNLTNDAWFGISSGPYQHFDMVKMRSAEYGIPLIRAANTGISGSVDPYGRVIKKLALQNEGFLDINLQKKLAFTIYSFMSQYYFLFLVIILILFISAFCKKSGNNL